MSMVLLGIFWGGLWRISVMALAMVVGVVLLHAFLERRNARRGVVGVGGDFMGMELCYYPVPRIEPWGHFRSNLRSYLLGGLALLTSGWIIVLLAFAFWVTYFLFLAYHHLPY